MYLSSYYDSLLLVCVTSLEVLQIFSQSGFSVVLVLHSPESVCLPLLRSLLAVHHLSEIKKTTLFSAYQNTVPLQ